MAKVIEEICVGDAHSIVVDLKLVAELDITGAKILQKAARQCEANETTLILSYEPNTAVAHHLRTLAVEEVVGSQQCFETVNDALGGAEDRLLDEFMGQNRYTEEHPLGSFSSLSELNQSEIDTLASLVVKREFKDEELIFSQAEEAKSLFFLAQGRTRILATASGKDSVTRLATICPGTLLGELSLIDKRPRSASAQADGTVVCYELEEGRFEELFASDPEIAGKVLAGVAREIATRLRIANRTVH